MSVNNGKPATLARLKGLIWFVGGIAVVFAIIFLAPVISHGG
jgi:hypothetical protein